MSRKHDRHQRELIAGLGILQQSIRPKPRWIPRLIWAPIFWLARQIVFR